MIRRPPRSTLFPSRRSSDLPNASESSEKIAERLKEGLTARETNGERHNGDAIKAIAEAAKKVEAVYSTPRSEEHTSELQSRQYIVCRLLLEKKKTTRPPSCK